MDECASNTDNCDRNTQKCVNEVPGFKCVCLEGFAPVEEATETPRCEDVNECRQDPGFVEAEAYWEAWTTKPKERETTYPRPPKPTKADSAYRNCYNKEYSSRKTYCENTLGSYKCVCEPHETLEDGICVGKHTLLGVLYSVQLTTRILAFPNVQSVHTVDFSTGITCENTPDFCKKGSFLPEDFWSCEEIGTAICTCDQTKYILDEDNTRCTGTSFSAEIGSLFAALSPH